jgi:hypothetical protein
MAGALQSGVGKEHMPVSQIAEVYCGVEDEDES